MTLPRLNRRLVLERAEQTADGAGGYDIVWTVLGNLWAGLSPRTGREVAQAGARVSRMAWRITVRAAPESAPSRPRPNDRLRMGARVFAVRAVADHDAAGLYLTCFADEEEAT